MKTPMGKKYGRLCLYEDGDILTGYIDILEHRNEIKNGEIKDGISSFSGELITPVRNISFQAIGIADNEAVSFHIKAECMEMYIYGNVDAEYG
jgi:hypothetical protein